MPNIATIIVTIRGIAVILTNIPRKIAAPPNTSTKGVIQDIRWGKGTFNCVNNFSKPPGPLLNFVHP
ncbi:hypothetical protein GCM10011511_31030 [Puia dinghuensis]|uniref:Uncharacterized protein n=1 Tax=Puia dinghuensis TaxID=1792502 RepID=A0A8J2UE67_9BACT|nr:hypothetical protein GCM10011511_31030 [Puia dinghuensis]